MRNHQDVASLREALEDHSISRYLAIRVRPEHHLLRDRAILEDIAAIANSASLVVHIEGSLLSHAYYVLAKLGVRVRTLDVLELDRDEREFGKLVRDHVPVRIERHGELTDVYRATPRELIALLKQKLVEEALEACQEEDADGIARELADVEEVVRGLAQACGIDLAVVQRIAERKRAERGGFEEGIVLVRTRGMPMSPVVTPETRPGKRTIRPNEVAEILLRRPQGRGNALSVPFVTRRLGRSSEFRVALAVKDTPLEARVTYTNEGVVIRLSDEPLRVDSRQLSLFDGTVDY